MRRMLRAVLPYLQRGSRVIAGVFLALAGVIFLIHAILSITFRYPLDYGEAPLVDQARRLLAGQGLYRADLTTPPYTISNYPPLYPLALVPGMVLYGPTFAFGRLLSVVCGLATAAALGSITWTHTGQRAASWLVAMTFLAWPYVLQWSVLLRVDLLALALSTWALFVVSRWPDSRRAIVLASLLLVGAVYTRQSYGFAAPLAAGVWLWTRRGWRRALLLGGVTAAIGGGLLLILTLMTHGGFWTHVVTANVNALDLNLIVRQSRVLISTAPLMLASGGVLLLLGPGHIPAWPLLAPYLVGGLASALTVGKVGSNVNYLLELCAALSLGSGALIAWLGQSEEDSRSGTGLWKTALGSVALVCIALQTGFMVRTSLQGPVQTLKERRQAVRQLAFLEALVRDSEDPILADEFMGLLTLQERKLYLQPFEMTQLALAGLWDQEPLLTQIREQQFSLILIHHFRDWPVYIERWTPRLQAGVRSSYEATRFQVDTVIFEPRIHRLLSVAASCPGVPWSAPTRGDFGVWWTSRELAFMGVGVEGTLPVVAVADGLLLRRPEWYDAVAIQHEDPLNNGRKVWTFYGNMASSSEGRSLVNPAYAPGIEGVPVERGQHLGYQGRTWGTRIGWVHLRFAVVPALDDGSFPEELLAFTERDDPRPTRDLDDLRLLDPSPYLGTRASPVMGQPVWLPFRCQP